ncbi:hypothetical protein [Lysinibacillus sp. NPDC086135]|uniref:hypothetical protein n=1 Tax=Lysinibacillus sp. NPDC086135 TaxID=3364130 RepID=UPI00380290D0
MNRGLSQKLVVSISASIPAGALGQQMSFMRKRSGSNMVFTVRKRSANESAATTTARC